MISKISSRVGARRIFVVRPSGIINTPTPTPTLTITPTPTPTPTIFIPENDLVYILIPNDDLTYTLIPSNDLIGTFIPDSDLLYNLIPNGDLNYILLPDNDLNGIDIPLNDINYTLIPNSDLTYTLIPNNDVTFEILRDTFGESWWWRDYTSQALSIYPDVMDSYEGVRDAGIISNWYGPGVYTGLGKRQITSGEKLMFSFVIDSDFEESDPNYWFGFGNLDTDLNNPLGSDSNSIGVTNLGEVFYDNSSYDNGYPTFGNIGDVIDVLIDCGNAFYYRVNGGYWNGNSNVNPLTGDGGIQYTFTDIYPSISLAGFMGPSVVKILNYVTYPLPIGYEYIYNTYVSPTPTPTETPISTETPTPTPTSTETSTPTPTPTPTLDVDGYRYYKWEISDTRSSNSQVQSSEFVFIDNGTDNSMTGITMSNPNGNNPIDSVEGANKIIDSNLNTKWFDQNFVGNPYVLIFDFGTQKIFTSYKWATGNDYIERDPKNWIIYGSNDGVSYRELSVVSDYISTEDRDTFNNVIYFDHVPTPTPTPEPTSTPTPTPTLCNHSYQYQLTNRTDVTNYFYTDLSNACIALECLTNSTCTITGSASPYFDNEIPQVGDRFYNSPTECSYGTVLDGYWVINLLTNGYMLVEISGGQIVSIPSCPTPTPTPTSTPTATPTSTPTPTPTPTESPLDFTISSDCVNGGAVYTNNHIGGSGVYDRGTGLYDTELEALNETGWFQITNPSHYVSNGVPYFNTTRTYWVALRDRNNQSNIVVKSVLVDCEPTPTPTPTSTPTPTPTAQPSGLIVTISEVGSDVIMSGSGSLNLTGLISGSAQTQGGINGTIGYWVIGAPNSFFSSKYQGNAFSTYPNSFGSGYTAPTSYSGDTFGIQDGSLGKDIIVPIGYTSGNPLSGTATFANKTISSMGLTPGTYTYSWGTDSITLEIEESTSTPTPTPTATPTPTPTQTPTSTPTPTPTGIVSSNLVLHFDPSNVSSYPGTGTTISDLSGNGINGLMSNNTFTSPYITYNGSSSQVSVADNVLLEPGTGDLTVEIWVNQSIISGSSRVLIAKTDSGLASGWGYGIRTSSNGSTYFEVGNGTTSIPSPTFTALPNTWYQFVGVYTNVASNSLELYVNGNSQGSVSHSFTSVKNTTNPLYVGSFNGGQFSQWLNGRVGIIRIYNKSLTSSEIVQNYNANKSLYGL